MAGNRHRRLSRYSLRDSGEFICRLELGAPVERDIQLRRSIPTRRMTERSRNFRDYVASQFFRHLQRYSFINPSAASQAWASFRPSPSENNQHVILRPSGARANGNRFQFADCAPQKVFDVLFEGLFARIQFAPESLAISIQSHCSQHLLP